MANDGFQQQIELDFFSRDDCLTDWENTAIIYSENQLPGTLFVTYRNSFLLQNHRLI